MKEKVKNAVNKVVDATIRIGKRIKAYMIDDTIKDLNKVLGEESTAHTKEGDNGKFN